jgi:hypothetical protein
MGKRDTDKCKISLHSLSNVELQALLPWTLRGTPDPLSSTSRNQLHSGSERPITQAWRPYLGGTKYVADPVRVALGVEDMQDCLGQ